MKKWGTMLLALALLAGMTAALADSIDFAPYTLEQSGYYLSMFQKMPDEHDLIASCNTRGTGDWCLVWWRDRAVYRVLGIEKGKGSYELLTRTDGSCGVVHITRAEDALQRSVILYDWTEEGLENGREIPVTGLVNYAVVKNGIALLDDNGSQTFLKLYDSYGILEAQIEVDRDINAVNRTARSGPGQWIAMVYQQDKTENKNLLIIRDGNVVGKIGPITLSFSGSLDGQGGFFMCSTKGESAYPPLEIARYDENGSLLWKKTLSGNKVVLDVHAYIDPVTGYTVLTGTAMANSRKAYRVYRMEVDGQGKTVRMDVRESNYQNSIYYSVYVFPDTGNTLVQFDQSIYYLNEYPAVLVPFDALPKADNPGIQLR